MKSDVKQDIQSNAAPIYPLTIAPYPWQRKLIYPVAVGLLGFALLGGLYAVYADTLIDRILGVIFGVMCLMGSWIGKDLARYRNHVAEVVADGVTITTQGDSIFYPWNKIAGFRNRRIAQIVELYVGNTRIFAVDYMTKDFRQFLECLSQNLQAI